MICLNKIMIKSNGIMMRKNKKKILKYFSNYDNLWFVEKIQVCKYYKIGCLIKFNE